MEFEVKTNLALMQPQKIESNVAEVREWLLKVLEPYKNLVVTEDAIAEAKQNRADINRLKKAIDEKRKATKKMWVSPYVLWENDVNSLLSLCDEAAQNIDSQVKSFEEEKKKQKKAELEAFFNEQAKAADVDFYVTFEQIFDPKWLNTTVSIASAKEKIESIVQETVDDIKVIADLDSDFAEELFLEYKESHDIKRVLSKNKSLNETRTHFESRRETLAGVDASAKVNSPPETETPQNVSQMPEKEKTKKYDLLLQLRLTEKQARMLKKYMDNDGIEVVQSKMKESKV